MATIITKNSQTASAVPGAASLSVGELAVNTADGKLYTEHTGGVVKEIIPSTVVDGGITTAKVADGAITSAKIADGTIATGDLANSSVTVAKLSASGSPSSSTFLRGDNTWAAPSSSSSLQYAIFNSSGTWTCPAGVTKVFAFVISGGTGATRPTNGSYGGQYGSNGASAWGYYTVTPGTSYSITVGSGGTGVASSSNSVTSTSGASSFGSFLTAAGLTLTQNFDTLSFGGGSITGATFGGTSPNLDFPILMGKQEGFAGSSSSSPVTWTTSSSFKPGAGGIYDEGPTRVWGGSSGAVYLEFVGA
jgi:hypothetical protein